MNVVSIEISKELHELSGWIGGSWVWARHEKTNEYRVQWLHDIDTGYYWVQDTTAYDLGYLLRKLPPATYLRKYVNDPLFVVAYERSYEAKYNVYGRGDTPEDAAAKLAIELFKQGVLTRGGDE